MKFNEILQESKSLMEYYFPEDDEGNKADIPDVRRVRLTLRHLHKLRKIRELKKLEAEQHKTFVAAMYGTPAEEGDGGF